MADYVEEYRHMSGVDLRSAEEDAPIEPYVHPTEKPETSYEDLVYTHHRVNLLRQWVEIQSEHARFGCPLDPAPDGSFYGACIIHGLRKGDREMTRDDYLGSFKEPREGVI